MDTRLVVAIVIVVGLPALLIGYILLIEAVLRLLPGRWQNRLRPWLWIAPALSFLGFFLVYPTINTVVRVASSTATHIRPMLLATSARFMPNIST